MKFSSIATTVFAIMLISLWLGLIGCSDDPAAPEEGDIRTVSRTIGPVGGGMSVTSADGVKLSVEIPAEAVLGDVDFSISALDVQPGQDARFRIQPAGFLLRAVTLTLVMPEAWVPGAWPGLRYGENVLVTDYDPAARTLTATTNYFGYGGSASKDADVDELIAASNECAPLLASLNAKLALAQTEGFYPPDLPKQIIDAYIELSVSCPDFAISIAEIEAALQDLACAEYSQAIAVMQEGLPSNADEIRQLLKRAVVAQGIKEQLGAPCGGPAEFQVDIEPVFEAYIQVKYDALLDNSNYLLTKDDWIGLWTELVAVYEVIGLTSDFGLAYAGVKIEEWVIDPLTTIMRGLAYRRCINDDQGYLGDLGAGGNLIVGGAGGTLPPGTSFDTDDLANDIQYCGSGLIIIVRDSQGEIMGTHELGQNQNDFVPNYEPQTEELLEFVPSTGKLDLTGTIRALKCVLSEPFSDQLEIRADSQVLATLDPTSGDFLASTHSIDIGETLALIGKNPGDSFFLRLGRKGTCAGFLDVPTTFDLFEIKVETEVGTVEMYYHRNNTSFRIKGTARNHETEEVTGFQFSDAKVGATLDPFELTLDLEDSRATPHESTAAEIKGSMTSTPDLEADSNGDGKAVFYDYTVEIPAMTLKANLTGSQGAPGTAGEEKLDNNTVAEFYSYSEVGFSLQEDPSTIMGEKSSFPKIYVSLDLTAQVAGGPICTNGTRGCVTATVSTPDGVFEFNQSTLEQLEFVPNGPQYWIKFALVAYSLAKYGENGNITTTVGATFNVSVDPGGGNTLLAKPER